MGNQLLLLPDARCPMRACMQVGNGDVVSVDAARALLAESGCHGIMVGRGAVQVRCLRTALAGIQLPTTPAKHACGLRRSGSVAALEVWDGMDHP